LLEVRALGPAELALAAAEEAVAEEEELDLPLGRSAGEDQGEGRVIGAVGYGSALCVEGERGVGDGHVGVGEELRRLEGAADPPERVGVEVVLGAGDGVAEGALLEQ